MSFATASATNFWKCLTPYCDHAAPPKNIHYPPSRTVLLVIGTLLLFLCVQGCSRDRNLIVGSRVLSPEELFQKLSPSVFVVESVDRNGKTLALGSAVAVSQNLLITNCHVVQDGSFLRVRHGANKWSGTLVEALPDHDLCGLRTDPPEPQAWDPVTEFHRRWPNAKLSDSEILTTLQDPVKFRSAFPNYDGLADDDIRKHMGSRTKPSGPTLSPVHVSLSSAVTTGERVYAIGAPEGLELTFSEGVVSSLRETDGAHIIQTSAPTSPGSSGGGLFDVRGNLIGITTFQLKEGQSLNFALPGEWVKSALDNLAENSHKSSNGPSEVQLESAAWLHIGSDAVKNENYELAVDAFQKSADLREGEASTSWLELGKLWGRASDIWGTSKAYQHWLCSTASRDDVICLSIGTPGNSTIRKSQDRAIAAFQDSIALRPDNAEAWLELAKAHNSRQQYDQGISAAKEATRLAPTDWMGWAVLGFSCISAEEYDQAIDAAQKGTRVTPADKQPVMLFLMGEAYAKKGDRAGVMRIYKQLKASNATNAEHFFKEYVLPQANEHSTTKRPKTDRDLLAILRNASITDDIRQAAWDAFHAAADANDFKRRFDAIPLPNEVKAQIWDLKFAPPHSTGNPPK